MKSFKKSLAELLIANQFIRPVRTKEGLHYEALLILNQLKAHSKKHELKWGSETLYSLAKSLRGYIKDSKYTNTVCLHIGLSLRFVEQGLSLDHSDEVIREIMKR